MKVVTHADVLPWQVDTAFFVQLIELAVLVVALLALAGFIYAGLHRLLSNRRQSARRQVRELSECGVVARSFDAICLEGSCDEA